MSEHEYDGIKELNNKMPRWWTATFILTVVFGIGYFAYYQLGSGTSIQSEFTADMKALEDLKNAKPKEKFPDLHEFQELTAKPEAVAQGKAVYDTKCVACHGDHGQGVVGPNLTDELPCFRASIRFAANANNGDFRQLRHSSEPDQ